MKIGPKYKIARRLGAPIFEKTQTAKYTLSLSRKEKTGSRRGPRGASEFGHQLIEKQKVRFSYGINERQFANYAERAIHSKTPAQTLFALIESRLDNVLYRAGFAKTRLQARQLASHGHVLVNDKRVTIPSILLKNGDKVSLRASSLASPLFADLAERIKTVSVPEWIKLDVDTKSITVQGEAVYKSEENLFDLGTVIEFYSR